MRKNLNFFWDLFELSLNHVLYSDFFIPDDASQCRVSTNNVKRGLETDIMGETKALRGIGKKLKLLWAKQSEVLALLPPLRVRHQPHQCQRVEKRSAMITCVIK